MKQIILSIFLIIKLTAVYSQTLNNNIIKFHRYYKGVGIILPNDYFPPFDIEDFASRFKPSCEDIEKVEQIIKNKWNKLYFDTIYFNYKKLRHRNRQYFCYKTKKNEKIVLVMFLNFKNNKKTKMYFNKWKKELILGFGSFYEKNTLLIKVNISKETIFR